jgi:hypothetical protein
MIGSEVLREVSHLCSGSLSAIAAQLSLDSIPVSVSYRGKSSASSHSCHSLHS